MSLWKTQPVSAATEHSAAAAAAETEPCPEACALHNECLCNRNEFPPAADGVRVGQVSLAVGRLPTLMLGSVRGPVIVTWLRWRLER